MVHFGNDWDTILDGEFAKTYYQNLRQFLLTEYRTQTIYPGMYDIFNALKYTPYSQVRAVILGQDPYHNPDQAHGLSFSVRKGVAPPPSLVNIFKEIKDDVGIDNTGKHGELTNWAKHGVLLLNTVLTVEQGAANAHASHGWETFTRAALEYAAAAGTAPLAAVLWGKPAQKYAAIFEKAAARRPVLVLESAPPSPLSAYRGFFGSAPFGKVNAFLENNGVSKIDWYLPANATHS